MDYSLHSNKKQDASPRQNRNSWDPKAIALVIIIIIIGAIICGAVLYKQKNQVSPINSININNNEPINQGNPNPPKEGTYFSAPQLDATDLSFQHPVPNTAVKWNGNPQLIADQKLVLSYYSDYYTGRPDEGSISTVYYNMGTHGNNTIILGIAPAMDPSGPTLLFFEKTSDGKYIFMSKISSYGVYGDNSQAGYLLSPVISSADTTIYYNGLLGPENLTWRGLSLEQPYLYPSDLFTNYLNQQKTIDTVNIKKIDSIADGDLYLYKQIYAIPDEQSPTSENIEKFYIKRYILKLKSGLFTAYNSKYTFFSDNSVPNINWLDGTKNQDTYRQEASLGGCGNPGAYVVSSSDVADLVKISGTTSTGESIYEFKDSSNRTEKFFYDLIEGKIYDYNTNEFNSISYQEWASYHPVIFYKTAIGEYAIFTNNKYGTSAECGKPVIYLYPTKPTNVTVKVGADITVSEPEYSNGWQVQANPDGTLKTINGNTYNSLFWEGIGYGMYPSITEGFIIKQSEVKTSLVLQLKELGLNKKESSDFLEFWLPKIPSTPYVRLTWFTNKQLDQLAPLIIWPKPDTTIRIFLDFQGLQNNISLPIQHFTSLPRKGFTVIEWGGLLRK